MECIRYSAIGVIYYDCKPRLQAGADPDGAQSASISKA